MNSAGSQASRPNLFGLTRQQLAEHLSHYGVPAFHARQVYSWLYAKRQLSPGAWTDLPRSLRASLADHAIVDPGGLAERTEAADGTVKFRTRLAGGDQVECVYMTHDDRVTLCLSSQVGCALNCDFCLTGKMGLRRNMSPGEIVGQVHLMVTDRNLQERSFNLVFMGMGEPLHNYDAVTSAIRLLCDPAGFGLSRRRITVSTSGLVPAIEKLADESVRPRLAVSLNATTDDVRSRLMPINRKYPIARLLEACRGFARRSRERVTLEYVLLGGVNDSDDDARRLANLVATLPAKVNLIPFNAVPGRLDYRPPATRRIRAIQRGLLEAGVPVSVRWSRGADARAACGQLALDGPDRTTSGSGGIGDSPGGVNP